MNKIVVIGLGYIGLPTAIVLANAGYQVLGVDVDPVKVDKVNRGELHFPEPGLQSALSRAFSSGRLQAAAEPQEGDCFIICVPTPLHLERKAGELYDRLPAAGMQYVEQAGEAIAPHLKPGNLVILESTSPVGTTRALLAPILEKSGFYAGRDFFLAYCPERVMPGNILNELENNARIIGGVDEEQSALKAREVYRSFCKGDLFLSSAEVAEFVKLTENSYRDVNVAFANELAGICEQVGVSVREVIKLANHHPRVNILSPGPGVGGHCIPIDPWFLIQTTPEKTPLLQAARLVNDRRPREIADQITALLKKSGQPAPIAALLGLTYKSEVDDIRESPAVEIAEILLQRGFSLRIFDPYVPKLPAALAGAEPAASPEAAVQGADVLALLVDHQEFKGLSPAGLLDLMRGKSIIDTRGIWILR